MEFLQCSDCNFAIKRTHHRFFLEYVFKTSPVVHNPRFFQKTGAYVRPSCRSAESSMMEFLQYIHRYIRR